MVVAAAQAGAAAGDDALMERLQTIAEKLEVSGPVQEAARLTFLAVAGAASRASWDAAAAGWAAVGEPYPRAQALWHAAAAALARGAREGAADRLRPPAAPRCAPGA